MLWQGFLARLSRRLAVTWFDVAVLTLLCVGGLVYLHDPLYWGVGWIGEAQYGDAEFWWRGALHVARGLFQDNPGQGYRPGYFILTGLTLPVLGEHFRQFYSYFLLTFLVASSFFYLSLRQWLGPWIAACVVAMLVFNPFTAEWLATSTTDGMGLLLSLLALACLLSGVNKGLQRGWLVAFAIFFALASLTRPLVTPFIGVVLLTLLFLSAESFKKRTITVIAVLLAFLLPTVAWMAVQKLTIDRWALSTNDASAFYAASDPQIQVWNPAMFNSIKQLAAERNHVALTQVNERQLNQTFWEETLKNYPRYPRYHFLRVLPHVWQIARFSPKMATKGTAFWQLLVLGAAAVGSGLVLVLQRRPWRAALLLACGLSLCLWHPVVPIMTLLGAACALLTRGRNNQLGLFLLALYWVTGVVALYLVGGTWGPPSFSNAFALNALGYRLGSQVFFVSDLLAAYFLFWLANFKLTRQALPLPRWLYPSPLAGSLVLTGFTLFVAALSMVYLIGGTLVVQRVYARSHAIVEPYPALHTALAFYHQHTGSKPILALSEHGGLGNKALTKLEAGSELIFTGSVSPFIWNMQGQQRAQLMLHTQRQLRPYTMGPNFMILEVPQHLDVAAWSGIQGAFVIRALANKHNDSNVAYYLTAPIVRAFIPLSPDRKSYALEKAQWFPVVKNATQLESSGELRVKNAKITWAMDSGPAKFQRRFFLMPQSSTKGPTKLKLHLDVDAAQSPVTLNFAYAVGELPGEKPSPTALQAAVLEIFTSHRKSTTGERLPVEQESLPLAEDARPLQKIKLTLPPRTQSVELSFNNILPGTGVWIYEFNLSAADFKR
jgi:4-amino-4-deoxy-L-arabinose transferase-like glycosyltransferase